jgi:hypothetical protein
MRDFTEKLYREAQEKAKKLKEMRESGLYTQKAIDEVRKNAVNELRQKYSDWIESNRKEYEAKLDKIRAKYQGGKKEIAEETLKFQRTQARIKASSTEELEKIADSFIRGAIKLSEDEANLLGSELRARGQTRLAEHIANTSTAEPWEEDLEYKKTLAELKKFDSIYGDTRLLPIEQGESQGIGQGEVVEFHHLEKVLDGKDTPITVKQRF